MRGSTWAGSPGQGRAGGEEGGGDEGGDGGRGGNGGGKVWSSSSSSSEKIKFPASTKRVWLNFSVMNTGTHASKKGPVHVLHCLSKTRRQVKGAGTLVRDLMVESRNHEVRCDCEASGLVWSGLVG